MTRGAATPDIELVEAVREAIAQDSLIVEGEKVVVGLSGGPDSLALLHCLWALSTQQSFHLRAAHLNHMLRGSEAEADALFAQQVCSEWGIPITVGREDVAAVAREEGLAVEEAARQVRYAFLGNVAAEVGAAAVAVGHNADDQVETVVMHFLRGSGLAGLRGMLPSVPLADLHIAGPRRFGKEVRLIRPLLSVPRQGIEQYCLEQGLQPRFDRSNLDATYFRNRLRHELIPYLESFNPNIRQVVRRMADVLAVDYDYLRRQAARAWQETVELADGCRVVFDLEAFASLHLSLQRSLIRQGIARLRPSLRNVSWIHVEQAVQALREAEGAGARVTLPGGLLLTMGYGRFAIAGEGTADPFAEGYPQLPKGLEEIPLPVPGTRALGAGWRVSVAVAQVEELPPGALTRDHPWTAYLDAASCGEGLVLRPRREGERLRPLGLGGHSKKLNELMINLKIPAPYRERYPILACGSRALWLPGFHIDHEARVTEDTERVLMVRLRPVPEVDEDGEPG